MEPTLEIQQYRTFRNFQGLSHNLPLRSVVKDHLILFAGIPFCDMVAEETNKCAPCYLKQYMPRKPIKWVCWKNKVQRSTIKEMGILHMTRICNKRTPCLF